MNSCSALAPVTLAVVAGCGGVEDTALLRTNPAALCEMRFANQEGWCGGDLSGDWWLASACNRTVLEAFQRECPEGSFEMHPGGVSGELVATSAHIDLKFALHSREPVTIDLHEACIRTLGTCPRSIDRNSLSCTGDFKTECHCEVAPTDIVGSNFGPVQIEGSEIAQTGIDDFSGSFCVDSRFLYLEDLSPAFWETHNYFYILEKDRW